MIPHHLEPMVFSASLEGLEGAIVPFWPLVLAHRIDARSHTLMHQLSMVN